MTSVEISIKWWYKPFIRFMPNFYEDMPKEKYGLWTTNVYIIPFSFIGTRYEKRRKGTYKSLQKAYLRARWRAFWVDFFDTTDRGIDWVIINKQKMTYEEKKKIADDYLKKEYGMAWDTLADINSLHDAETEEDVIELAQERAERDLYE